MGGTHGRLTLILCTGTLVLAGLGWGCGSAKSKKILSFFIDGVPVETDSTRDTTTVTTARNLRDTLEVQRKAVLDSLTAANQFEMHPPYAAGECTSCHNMSSPESSAVSRSSMPSLSVDRAAGSGWLILPVEELCVTCHSDKSLEYAEENNLNIHGPVAAGECLTCHYPHRSRYRKLLRAKTARTLCFQCHEESIPEGLGDHPELEVSDDCTDCHNPHLSSEEFFLE